MTSLTSVLALYGLVVLITILVQVLAASQKLELTQLVGNRETLPSLGGAAGRLDRAQMNSVVAMALFAPPVLILAQQGVTGGAALIAAYIFLLARIAYVIVYALGIPWVRTIVWLVGFAMTFWLYLLAL
ncbi:membrane protein [Oceanicola sp. 22II-s10i]|uniref:MAPEG family protein n=1 Tax=Oceanicola sp. 22II-s10i TaxID=1317116 RepID=UPI000B520916|nr:MAPEG family protein [Oceanicola sp. 22II-s10i]OWU85403.1 membrane protein [Oceanicola sp. 22II-s10i]